VATGFRSFQLQKERRITNTDARCRSGSRSPDKPRLMASEQPLKPSISLPTRNIFRSAVVELVHDPPSQNLGSHSTLLDQMPSTSLVPPVGCPSRPGTTALLFLTVPSSPRILTLKGRRRTPPGYTVGSKGRFCHSYDILQDRISHRADEISGDFGPYIARSKKRLIIAHRHSLGVHRDESLVSNPPKTLLAFADELGVQTLSAPIIALLRSPALPLPR